MSPRIPFSQYVRQNKSAIGLVFVSTLLIGCSEVLRRQTNNDLDGFSALKATEQIDLLKRDKVDFRSIPSNIVYVDPKDDNSKSGSQKE